MELKSKVPIGLMAVVVDEAAQKVEAVNVDTLRMMAMVVNHQTKAMQFAFAWGGYDSTGKFHMDPHRPASHRSIQANVDGEREIWQACACDDHGNPVLDHGEAFVRKVLVDHKKLHDIVNGGWAFDEIELTHKGDQVFKKEKKKSS